MGPDPDWTFKLGRLLVRRWGRFVRINVRNWTYAFNLPRYGN